jgi:hypothetical protein
MVSFSSQPLSLRQLLPSRGTVLIEVKSTEPGNRIFRGPAEKPVFLALANLAQDFPCKSRRLGKESGS